jgi:hypothetical protein
MSCFTYTIVVFYRQIRLTSRDRSSDRHFRFRHNPRPSYGIVVNLRVYLREYRMWIGARLQKRVKLFLQKNRATQRYFLLAQPNSVRAAFQLFLVQLSNPRSVGVRQP